LSIETDMSYTILLYYKYTTLTNPEEIVLEQKELCAKLGLKGRIIIAPEGINGTVEGLTEATNDYIKVMNESTLFKDIEYKSSVGTGNAFRKLSIKLRQELVSGHLGIDDVNPNVTTGKYVSAEELHEWFRTNKRFYIVDMRNDYEYKVGYFINSIQPNLKNFRDLPNTLPQLSHLTDEVVVTVCTGGVRCKKASGLLINKGFKDVYQLRGGIHTYMEKYPNQDFKGKLYVFDARITMGFNLNSPDHEVVSNCERCGDKSDLYIDCGNIHCVSHRHFLSCEKCICRGDKFCSDNCREIYTNFQSTLTNISQSLKS